MPSGKLGAYISLGFTLAFILRSIVIKKVVEAASLIDQAKKQFTVELLLMLMVGTISIVMNNVMAGVPLISGISFFIGFLSFGFFIAIDMSLERERQVIEKAMEDSHDAIVPQKFYPMTRKFFIVAVVTNLLVMIIIILVIARDMSWLAGMEVSSMNLMLDMVTKTIFKEITFIIVVLLIMVINVLYSYSKNLKMLFQTETGVLESVTNGDLSRLVPVATNDEFGVIATNTNKMIHGLRDRIRILARLKMAKEVQENLLPHKAPEIDQADIAGASLYCEEVGGDYYDYFDLGENKIGIAVTDSSGHGVGAGLHMATIRALFRHGVQNYPGAGELISAVNCLLTEDSYETGRFTTVFFIEIDFEKKEILWVRAGHEPALIYNPEEGTVEKLQGNGMALGVDAGMEINESRIDGWASGTVLVIYSDGLKESTNPSGEMYTEKRIGKVLEAHASLSAREIQEKLLEDLKAFVQNRSIEDDITVVVVKFL